MFKASEVKLIPNKKTSKRRRSSKCRKRVRVANLLKKIFKPDSDVIQADPIKQDPTLGPITPESVLGPPPPVETEEVLSFEEKCARYNSAIQAIYREKVDIRVKLLSAHQDLAAAGYSHEILMKVITLENKLSDLEVRVQDLLLRYWS